jgi:ribonuclease HI
VTSVTNGHSKYVLVKHRAVHQIWFDGKLRAEKKEVGRLCRKAVKTKKTSDWDLFRAGRRLYTRNLKKASTSSYRQMATDLPSLTDMAKFTKMVRKQPRHEVGVMIRPDGSFTTEPAEAVAMVMDKAFPESVEPPDDLGVQTYYINSMDGLFTYPEYDWMSNTAIRESFAQFKNNKSAGPDGFKPRVLKQLPEVAISRLRQLFEASYYSGYVPQLWLQARVVFISKPGKDNYSKPGSFRPISLTSFIFKCMERLVYKNLLATSLKDNPLCERQHGFRHGMSCDTALSMAVGKIERGLKKRKGLAIAFFADISGAFDNVDIDYCAKAMLERGFPEDMVKWYAFYLRNRVCFTTIKGVTVWRLLTKGVPQGGILSPLAWNCVIDVLLRKFDRDYYDGINYINSVWYPDEPYPGTEEGDDILDDEVVVPGFADDVSAIAEGTDPGHVRSRVQEAIDVISAWVQEAGLELSSEKSVAMLFRKTEAVWEPNKLHVNGREIEYAEEARYLGVILDPKLSFRPHIEKKIRTAKMLLMQLGSSMGKLWGPSPYLTRWAYLCVVRPALVFGHFVWGHRVKPFKYKLDVLQAMALRLTGNLRRSTPRDGMNIVLNVPPLDLFIKFEVRRSYFRLEGMLRKRYYPSCEFGHHKAAKALYDEMELERATPDFTDELVYQQHFSPFISDSGQLAPDEDRVQVFTDGSKLPDNRTGYGVFFNIAGRDHCHKQHIGLHPTVFQAEVLAIQEGCELIARHLDRNRAVPRKVTIYSDSQSAIKALSSRRVRSKTVRNCRNALNELGLSRVSVRLRWVKAHVGIFGNEQADSLAKEAAENVGEVPPPDIPRSYSYYRKLFKDFMYEEWKSRWQGGDPEFCRQTKIWFDGPFPSVSHAILKQSRPTFSRLVRWLTGHAFLRLQNFRADPNVTSQSLCRLCRMVPERADHLLLHCPRLLHVRRNSFQTNNIDTSQPSWQVRHILTFLRDSVVSTLEFPEVIPEVNPYDADNESSGDDC